MRWLLLLPALSACRAERAPALPLVYDALGLPDCAASYDTIAVCEALKPFTSTVPDDFREGLWVNVPLRWIGTEVDPAWCAETAAEAEAWVLAAEPEAEGESHLVDTRDARWVEVLRKDADGVVYERQRVTRCEWMPELDATPPGLGIDDTFARYATVPADDPDDFFPVAREMTYWRTSRLPVQVVLSWGQAQTESLHLATCNVRCGECEDDGGGRYRNVTGVLERLDWTLDSASGVVSFAATPLLETECYADW